MPKKYDLEDRTFEFAQNIRLFLKTIPKTLSNIEDSKQLTKSSGSVGANYIEANEALSKKDFLMRVKICRKEAKESTFWLKLIKEASVWENETEITELINESIELKKIFSAIIEKSK